VKIRRLFIACSLACSAVLVACSGRPAASAQAGAAAPALTRAEQPPPVAAHAPASGAQTSTGTVLETMNASNYTYVRVKTSAGELWVAASQFPVAVGDTVSFSLDQPMENFHSQALGRDFPLIYFVSDISRNGAPAASSDVPPEHAAARAKASATPVVTDVISPAKGGATVQAVWKDRAALSGRAVIVRGKVVKFNGGILGANWLHIQDGTGSAADGTNDLTVTTDGEARVGDVVTITGTVAVNKDFGAGYSYAVIVEHAKVARE
jgi:hypothetical protein